MPLRARSLPVAVLAVAPLASATRAHPDHDATQAGVVEPVPSTQKPTLENRISIMIEDDKRVIAANGIPDHATGRFPNRNNPNRISEQLHKFSVPLKPVFALRSDYRLKKGERPTSGGQPGGAYDGVFVEDFEHVPGSGDLDECSGRFGPTPEFPEGVHHYVPTEDFPFIPRFFRGVPDSSFSLRPGPGNGGPGAGPRPAGPRPPAPD